MILPKTPQGKAELKKELAKFHADHIQQVVQRLPCPVEQKLELIDSVIGVVHCKCSRKSPKNLLN